MKTLTRVDLSDILHGCAILGTGGGGELDEGFYYIDKALAEGKTFKLVSVDDVPQGKKICTPYMLGALSPMTPEEEQQYTRLPKSSSSSIMTAFRRLEKYTGDEFYGTICCELGGSNTAISFYVAAMANGYIIDADVAGRAVPEITHSTYYFNNIPAAPIVTANEFGECFICENVIDDLRAENVVRALSMISRNDIAAIDHAMPIEQVKDAVIKGTISKSLEIGKAYRLAKENNQDIADAIASHGGGYVAFRGSIAKYQFKTQDGFTLGDIFIEGTGQHLNDRYHIEVKNENLVSRLNGVVDVTIPDLICCLDMDSNSPITNPNVSYGVNVAVIVLPAPKEFVTEKGLQAFGPAYVGIDAPYQAAVERHFLQATHFENHD
ncbi:MULTISPECIES: DUF917 domain-containing protein [unclassified Shewanella]|uniref:DUF917 domain-containing protein n=1 Tax=unclassified Shewanella TaxID=196818 RepID=UPI000C83F122|nr:MULTISPECIES: DUF917 domain-containing protein [unclassified Shewanella]PMG42264.1 hypothetical protein BCU91_08460 [Shewanella sp. 10N.286.52.B9]PMI00382.1 hypothetical protein BCU55_11510 [Shewanella sp. 10N.286.48.A6]